jgi:hypothetical protein
MRAGGGTDVAVPVSVRPVLAAIAKLVEKVTQAAPLRLRPSLVPVPVPVTQRPAPRARRSAGALRW